MSVSFVIDSPSLPSILHIARGTMNIMESNKHGEGDVGVWHHCLCQPERNFILSVWIVLGHLFQHLMVLQSMALFLRHGPTGQCQIFQ